MNGNEHIDIEDLALFALLLLSEEEADAVRAHLSTCAQCREELQRVREDLATYALAVEPVEPRQEAREKFIARLSNGEREPEFATQTPMNQAPAGPRTGAGSGMPAGQAAKRRGPASRALPWIGWAAAAAALVAMLQIRQDRDQLRTALMTEHSNTAAAEAEAQSARHVLQALSDPSAVRVNLTVPKAPAAPAARATYEPRSGTLLLFASNLAPLASEKVYELWLIPANGDSPVAAGTFSPDAHGNVSLLLPTLHRAIVAKAFGITVEPTGGSSTPTMPILLAGAPA